MCRYLRKDFSLIRYFPRALSWSKTTSISTRSNTLKRSRASEFRAEYRLRFSGNIKPQSGHKVAIFLHLFAENMYIQWFIKWGSLFSKSVFLEIIITRIRIWEITTGKTNQTSVICKNDNTMPKGCHARFKFSNIKKVCILSTYSVINYPVRFWCFWKLTWEVSLLYWIWKRCLSKIRIKRLIQQFWQYSKHFFWDI